MDEEDELLAEEAGKQHRIAMQIVGFDIFPRLLSAPTRWIVRRQPKNVCELPLSLLEESEAVRERATLVLRNHGELIEEAAESGYHRIRGAVHIGYRGWGRAVVTVTVQKAPGHSSDVLVRSVSKEGWIKCYYGEKCARLVADTLRQPATEPQG